MFRGAPYIVHGQDEVLLELVKIGTGRLHWGATRRRAWNQKLNGGHCKSARDHSAQRPVRRLTESTMCFLLNILPGTSDCAQTAPPLRSECVDRFVRWSSNVERVCNGSASVA